MAITLTKNEVLKSEEHAVALPLARRRQREAYIRQFQWNR
jgi:hypothetical protein